MVKTRSPRVETHAATRRIVIKKSSKLSELTPFEKGLIRTQVNAQTPERLTTGHTSSVELLNVPWGGPKDDTDLVHELGIEYTVIRYGAKEIEIEASVLYDSGPHM